MDRETGEERAELLAPKLSIAETSGQRAGHPPDKGEASGKVGTVRLSGSDQRRYRRD
jgi:hypothetical protein